MLKVKHSGSIGDIIYSFPYLNSLDQKFDFYIGELSLVTGVPNKYISKDEIANFQRLFPKSKDFIVEDDYSNYKMCKDLLEIQPSVNRVYPYNGEEIDINLDDFRTTYSGGLLPLGISEHFGVTFDAEKPFLYVDKALPEFQTTCVCARSGRYRGINSEFKWKELMEGILNDPKSNIDRFVFIGLEKEYNDFQQVIDPIQWIPTHNLYEAAVIINSCPMGMFNGSSPLAISAGLGKIRAVECTNYKDEVPIRRNMCANSIITGSGKEFLF